MRGVAAVVAVLAASTLAGAAPTSAPALRLRAREGGVRVHWTYRGEPAVAGSTLEIERATGSGAFARVGTVAKPKRRAEWNDAVATAGTYAYRARIVQPSATTAWSDTASITIAGGADPGPEPGSGGGDPPLPSGQRECPAGSTAGVLQLVNDARRDHGRATLADDAALARAARTHTIAMVAAQRLTHDGWIGYIRAAGYAGGALGENIAYGYQSPASVVQGWMKSSGHRANILSSSYRHSGVGCVMDSRGRLWWTHDFGG
jgi:uncharacterized protein YkwD